MKTLQSTTQANGMATPGGAPAGDGAAGGRNAAASGTGAAKPLHPLQRMLVRGETAVASAGILLAAILLGSMAAASWCALREQQEASASARADQVHTVAVLIRQSAEPLLANNELSAVRRLVADAGRQQSLTRCRIVLPDGQVIADAEASKITLPVLPATWGDGNAPAEPASALPGAVNFSMPLSVPGRGAAELQIEAHVARPLWSFWETQSGVGSIGAFAMIALLLVYRKMRARLRAVGAIREALLALKLAGGPSAVSSVSTLLVSPNLGPEAEAWNELMAESEKTRKQSIAERAREVLGRRGQSKGELESACDAMSQGLVVVDERNCVKYANGAAAQFLQADRNAINGADLSRFLHVPKVLDAIREVATGVLRRRSVIDVERKGGENGGDDSGAGVLRFSVRPVRREDSAAAMVVIEDITQQKAAEEARHAFVAQATHELRTPLTNIRLYVETAIEEGEKDPLTRAKCLNVINGETRRLERIVGEMLSVAEIEAGSFKLKSDDIRVDAMIDELRADFEEQAREKEIRLVFQLPPKLPVLQGDRDKVNLALHNLLGNALKYTPAGGAVTVEVQSDARSFAVAVKDTGIGISPDDAERIFERFYRAKDSRVAKITGSGLGLTLAREVARLHGGEINVDSILNQGSTFTLTLPVKAQAAAAAA